ncbi:MAG: DUF6326 family protein [Bacteroidota bacterium]
MEKITKTTGMKNRKIVLSTLWIFVTFNWLYCDVMTLMDPIQLKQVLTNTAGAIQMTEGFLLGAAIVMEIPIALILLSRILKYRANRWTNIIAGIIMMAVQIMSLFVGTPSLSYIFYSAVEISCTIFIVWYAWSWRKTEDVPDSNI